MKLLRKNKYTVICITICTIVLIIALALFKLLFPNTGTPVYGNRLDDVKNLQITESMLKKHNDSINNDSLKEISAHTIGKIVNVNIVMKKGATIKIAKEIATSYVALFTDDEKEHYDFSIFIINEEDDTEGYPLIGQKSKLSDSIVYNKE